MSQPLNVSEEAHAARHYTDPTDPERRKLKGVTSIIKGAMPPYLVPWAAKLSAEFAVDSLDAWNRAELDREARIDLIKQAPDRARDKAGNTGSIVHAAIEAHTQGREPHAVYDAEALPYISAPRRFLDEWQPSFHWIEASVFHPELGYAGTLDFIAEVPTLGTVIGDWKTSKNVYGEMGIQLAAYRHASHAVSERHERLAIPTVDGGVIVHLKGDGTYSVLPTRCGEEEFEVFTHAIAISEFKSTRVRSLVGAALPTPAVIERAVEQVTEAFPGTVDVTPCSAARREWITERVRAIVAHADGGAWLAQRWPNDVPTLKDSAEHTDAQVDLIAAACSAVEGLLKLPFPDTDPAHPSMAPKVAATDPRIAALAERVSALASDLVGSIESAAKELRIPRLSSGQCTEEQLSQIVGLVTEAEDEAAFRSGVISTHLSTVSALDADLLAVVSLVVPTGVGDVPAAASRMTARELNFLSAVVEALSISHIRPDLTVNEAAVVATFANKRDALNAAKRAAKANDRNTPKNFADLLGDPVLVALALAELTSPGDQEAA